MQEDFFKQEKFGCCCCDYNFSFYKSKIYNFFHSGFFADFFQL